MEMNLLIAYVVLQLWLVYQVVHLIQTVILR